MFKCFQCGQDITDESQMEFLYPDFDPVCNQKCKEKHDQERDHFLNVTIHDDTLYSTWLTQGMSPEMEKITKQSLER